MSRKSDIFYLLGRYAGGLVLVHVKGNNQHAVDDLHRAMEDLMPDPETALAIYSERILTISRYWCVDQPAIDHDVAAEIWHLLRHGSPIMTIEYRNGQVKWYNSSFKPIIKYKIETVININYIFADYE